ncbi:helix-turn-helix transcriptional regulator [Lampropedia aestuarii]|uniref:helix-turn-helix transcriptional regulator n=1 Tax=Lampropedia aestuarii TaxID=2562762 RepID=UPI003CC82BC6
MNSKELFPQVLRINKVAQIIGMSRTSVYDFINPKSPRYDPDFPQQLRLSTSPRGAVGWRSDEIYAWLDTRQRAHNS